MKYRAEIDGLRAIAIIPVILFHAGFQLFEGGFVGVDVFFVISGYLITAIIVRDIKHGSFSLPEFYEKRARRILPALFFMMLVSLPFAYLWMLSKDFADYAWSLLVAPLFVSNVLFWWTRDYFDIAAEYKPLLHTWSLSVEEQFYLLFPIFLIIMGNFKFLNKKFVFSIILLFTLVSLSAAQYGSTAHPTFSFYFLPTRGFEILTGAIVALSIDSIRRASNTFIDECMSTIGLMLISYSIFFFSKHTPTPSVWTLIPVCGACLIIFFCTKQTHAGKMLGSKVFVGCGLISYSAYLWHQPLFAFARLRAIETLSNIDLLFLCCLSLTLGFLSYKFIETPFRNTRIISQKKFFILTISLGISLIVLSIAIIVNNGFPHRIDIPVEVSSSIIHTQLRQECDIDFDKRTGKNIDFCNIGDLSQPDIKLAILGDSHSEAILPAFDHIGRNRGEKYTHLGLGGCPPLLNTDVAKGNYRPKICEDLALKQFNFVIHHDIKNVLFAARWSLYTDGDYNASKIYYLVSDKHPLVNQASSRINFEDGLRQTIKKYQRHNVNVFVLAQIPHQRVAGDVLFTKLYYFDAREKEHVVEKLSIETEKHLRLQKFNRSVIDSLQKELNFNFVNLDSELCNVSKCLIGRGEGATLTSLYSDDDHLSVHGAMMLERALDNAIKLKH